MNPKIDLDFREWLLLSEIGHVGLSQQVRLPLPDRHGNPQSVPVYMCDPKFETYSPVGHRRNDQDELEEYTWQQMVNMRDGIGWEGLIPFTHSLYFGCAPMERYATIGPSRNLIRAPDDWYTHALFIDEAGNVSYDAPSGIFSPSDARMAYAN